MGDIHGLLLQRRDKMMVTANEVSEKLRNAGFPYQFVDRVLDQAREIATDDYIDDVNLVNAKR